MPVRTYAYSGTARAGATRSNDHDNLAYVTIAGTPRYSGLHKATLVINQILREEPDTCQFTVGGEKPVVGQEVKVTLGSAYNRERIFAGHIIGVQQHYLADNPHATANTVWACSCVDYTWQLSFRTVTKLYRAMSASAIAADLIATFAPPGFTANHIEADMPVVDEISFTDVLLPAAMTRLMDRVGGYWRPDYHRDIHAWIGEEAGAEDPTPLTDTTPYLRDVQHHRDLGQVVTRAIVQGGGGTTAMAVDPGETILPVDAPEWYQSEGGRVRCGPQDIDYGGVTIGGGGGLVGPGATPSGAPALALASGAGIETGAHGYAVTFVTSAGESLPSPIASITVGPLDAPTTAPTAGAPLPGAGPDLGAHDYAVTFVTSAGETTPSPISAAVITTAASPPPKPTASWGTGTGPLTAGVYQWAVTFSSGSLEPPNPNGFAKASPETALSEAVSFTALAGQRVKINVAVPSWATYVNVYRTEVGGSTFHFEAHSSRGLWISQGGYNAGFVSDAALVSTINIDPPVTGAINLQTVPLSAIPLGGALVTQRKIYRTEADGSQLKLAHTLANNTTTVWIDTVADAGLGANAPVTNTAAANQVSLSGIPIGDASVIERNLYRTAADDPQLKLLANIADNTTTTASDSAADGTLGSNAPVSDTSGLTQPQGQVAPGATTILVANAGAFPAEGWAIIGNGQQVIRYTGVSGSSLTGIPASGPGAIVAAIAFNSTITAAPALTGIPANGAGAIQTAIAKGVAVNILAQADDGPAQTTMAALMGGDGIREGRLSDNRLSYTEALARARALLEERSEPIDTLRYAIRDRRTTPGRQIAVALSAPTALSTTLRIQQVTITGFDQSKGLPPLFSTQATSLLFTFEDLLRQQRG